MTNTESEAVAWRARNYEDNDWTVAPCQFSPRHYLKIEPLYPASSLASRDARIAELESLLEEAVKGLEAINEIWVEAKRHSPDDDFDRGSRAGRAEASDLARATLTAIKGGK